MRSKFLSSLFAAAAIAAYRVTPEGEKPPGGAGAATAEKPLGAADLHGPGRAAADKAARKAKADAAKAAKAAEAAKKKEEAKKRRASGPKTPRFSTVRFVAERMKETGKPFDIALRTLGPAFALELSRTLGGKVETVESIDKRIADHRTKVAELEALRASISTRGERGAVLVKRLTDAADGIAAMRAPLLPAAPATPSS